MPVLFNSFNTVFKVLARAVRQEQVAKGIQIRREVKFPLFVHNLILYIKENTDSTPKLSEQINVPSRVEGNKPTYKNQ